VTEFDTMEPIIHLVLDKARFNGKPFKMISHIGRGLVNLTDGKLRICSSHLMDSAIRAFDTADGFVEILTKNTREEKLKTSNANDADAISVFAKTFALTQEESGKTRPKASLPELKIGKKVYVEAIGTTVDRQGESAIEVAAIGMRDERPGFILNEELVKGLSTQDLFPDFIYGGDCFPEAEVKRVGDVPEFSIKDSYVSFAKHKAWSDERNNIHFEARALKLNKEKDRIVWMTAGGYGALSLMMEGVKEGDIRVLCNQNVQTGPAGVFINVEPPTFDSPSPVKKFEEDSVLSEYILSRSDVPDTAPEDSDYAANKETLRELATILLYGAASVPSSLDRYRRILASRFLYNAIADEEGVSAASRQADVLVNLLSFAQGGPVSSEGLDGDDASLLKVLSAFGREEKVADVMKIITEHAVDDKLSEIASLVYALGVSDRFADDVKADSDEIRKHICEMIGVADAFRYSGISAKGKYGSEEGHKLEFKASYVMRNDGKGPDLDYQGRGQVFEAVCGFLNSDGGTVYIGVNDKTGDPIISEGAGVKGDMDYICQNFQTIGKARSSMLGHPVSKPDSLDHFCLFLNSEKEIFFKRSLLDNIIIEPTEDRDAVRISVKPSLYEIAYLYNDATHTEGKAYTRNGNRTIPMSKDAMEKRLMNQKHIAKEVGFIVTIQDAINRQRKLIFRGYSSGNSGHVGDRLVVPINLFYNDENVYCYDLDAKDFRQFRLARIQSIDTEVENPGYPHSFEAREADVFRWVGEENYHIKLRMKLAARNYLLEEYSNAKNLPETEFYPIENDEWILDTTVHGLGAVRRFYLGLADKIEILPTEHSEALKEDIKRFLAGLEKGSKQQA